MRLRARAPSSPLHHEPFLLETAEEPESSSNGSLPKQQRGGSRRRWAAALPTVMLTVLAALWVALVVAVVLGMELDTWRAARQVGKAGGHPVILGQGTATVGGRTEQASPLAAPSGVGWSGMGQPGSQPTRPGEGSGLDEWAASEPRVSSGSSGGAGPAGAPDEHWSAEAERLVREMERHVVEYGPAGSFWPAGCRWRASTASPAPSGAACDPAKVRQRGLMFGGVGSVWRCHDYEWWDESSQSWTAEQPEACRLQTASLEAWAHEQAAAKVGGTGSAAWQGQPQLSTWTMEALKGSQGQDGAQHKAADWKQESAADNAGGGGTATPPHGQQHPPGGLGGDDLATDVRCAGHYCAFRNLWYSGGRFYALQEPGSRARFQGEWQLGRNRQGGVLHVASAAEWARSVRVRVAPGETVLLDWLFFLHPTALGHWLESLLPLFRWAGAQGGANAAAASRICMSVAAPACCPPSSHHGLLRMPCCLAACCGTSPLCGAPPTVCWCSSSSGPTCLTG